MNGCRVWFDFSALISAFEKSKKKYQGKMKKMEAQLHSVVERYEAQVRVVSAERSRGVTRRLPDATRIPKIDGETTKKFECHAMAKERCALFMLSPCHGLERYQPDSL